MPAPSNYKTQMLPGQATWAFGLAALLTFPVSFLLLRLYRRAVLKSMTLGSSAPAAASPDSPSGLPPAASPAPLQIITLQEPDAAPLAPHAQAHYRQAVRTPWRAAVVYSLGSVCFAGFVTAALLLAGNIPLSPMRFLILFWVFIWPLCITLCLVAGSSMRVKLQLAVAYFCLYALIGAIAVALSQKFSFSDLVVLWFVTLAPATVLIFAVINSRVRAVGPLVLTFLTICFTGSLIPSIYFAIDQKNFLAFARPILELLAALHMRRFAPEIIAYGLPLLTFVAFAALAWPLLQWLRSGYEHKKLSDHSLTLDSLWLLFTLVYSFSRFIFFDSSFWMLAPLGGFLAYKMILAFIFPRFLRPNPGPGVKLLLLRVFALGKRSERLFHSLATHWRYLGPIQMIAGPDLATSTVEPHEFLQFITGKLARRFIGSPAVLEQRLAEMDLQPDRDWRYRINDFFCFADTWQLVLHRLAADTDAVLMDLRSFSRDRAGCIFEIGELLNSVPLARTVFVIDATTDEPYLRQVVQQAWQGLSPASPNYGLPDLRLRLVHYTGDQSLDLLLRTLCAAAS